jgi:hypothetical protein
MNFHLSKVGGATAPAVLLVGVWDPVLPDHLDLFRQLRDHAAARSLRPIVATIDPPPGSYVQASSMWPIYDDLPSRLALQASCGIDDTLIVEMVADDLRLTATDFLGAVTEQLALKELWLGRNQTFGSGPSGAMPAIRQFASARDISVRVLPASLTRFTCGLIRQLLVSGRLREAIEVVKRPPTRSRPSSGLLSLTWAPGTYTVVSIDRSTRSVTSQSRRLTLSRAEGFASLVPWPDDVESLAFLSGPADDTAAQTGVSALTEALLDLSQAGELTSLPLNPGGSSSARR